jgi:hypothetical protein
MKEMADFSVIRCHFESNNLPYFTFCPKSQKPIEAVIPHLPGSAPTDDISDGLVNLGFDVKPHTQEVLFPQPISVVSHSVSKHHNN